MRPLAFVLLLALAQVVSTPPTPPAARALAPDTYLLPGAILPERGPDGNTVVFVGPEGLVVVDTGRHPWHSDGILAFARERKLPVAAIVNTHWHLDHSSGNGRIKAEHSAAKVYTTAAVNRALAPGGFLARNHADAVAKGAGPGASAARQDETRLFLTTMEHADELKPDITIERSTALELAGRALAMNVAPNAVTDADLWLHDKATGVVVVGDLVTFPAPFFETACPARWAAALDDVWATPFRTAVPGHGAPMTRDQFNTYRAAFNRFRACAGGDGPPATCAADWTRDVAAFLTSEAERKQATDFATYYVAFLRKGGGASEDCHVK